MQNKGVDIVRNFCISGFKVSIAMIIFIITLASILFVFGVHININMKDLIGLNILDVTISKESLDLSIKPLGMLSVFIIGGAIGIFQKLKK